MASIRISANLWAILCAVFFYSSAFTTFIIVDGVARLSPKTAKGSDAHMIMIVVLILGSIGLMFIPYIKSWSAAEQRGGRVISINGISTMALLIQAVAAMALFFVGANLDQNRKLVESIFEFLGNMEDVSGVLLPIPYGLLFFWLCTSSIFSDLVRSANAKSSDSG